MDRIFQKLREHRLRIILFFAALVVSLSVFAARGFLPARVVALAGLAVFFGLMVALSRNPAKVEWRTVAAGIALQVLLALFVLKTSIGMGIFFFIGKVVEKFLAFSDAGARFVFGIFVDEAAMAQVFGQGSGFVFAFRALPTIIFVSSFFTMLYYMGVLQLVVRGLARVMVRVMKTSGAESLSSAANIFMGQTEAPLIIKPYLMTLTRSEPSVGSSVAPSPSQPTPGSASVSTTRSLHRSSASPKLS